MASQHLFAPLTLSGITFKNRIGVSPMCMYSSEDGFATDWHLVHIGSRAVGGAALVIMEATAVAPEGRITPACLGLWKDAHIDKLKQITDFAKSQGAVIGIQLAHAGRKASMGKPWDGGKPVGESAGGWTRVAPSAIPFNPDQTPPHALTPEEIAKVKADFIAAGHRAVRAGFQLVEIHGAHGYLLNEFLSPLSNARADEYGGSFENRTRLFVEIARDLRAALPKDIVIGARISATDWKEGGWTLDDSVALAKILKQEGVAFIDCSSGGLVPDAKIPAGPNYQVPFAREIREKAGIPTMAVGVITEAQQANDIIAKGEADMVLLARGMLHDPYWAIHAAEALREETALPPQYLRGFDLTRFKKAG